MPNPSREEGLARLSVISHVTSDALASVLLLLEHLKRNVYTVEDAQDHLIGNSEAIPPSPGV